MLKLIRSVGDLRDLARKRVPGPIFDFIDGGAYEEATLRRNIADLERLCFRQRVARDVSVRRISTRILGQPSSIPAIIAPTGISGVVHGGTNGELLAARAADAVDIPYTLGMMSIIAIEELKREIGSFWFQICTLKDRDLMAAMIDRAKAAACPVLVLTMTWPLPSDMRRLRRNPSGAMPPRFKPRTLITYGSKPSWSMRALTGGRARFGNFDVHRPGVPLADIMQQLEPAVSWDDVKRVRDLWGGKLLVKGIMDPQDAEMAVKLGADGISVSNHGGNQLDGAPSTISVLPSIVAEVGGRIEVLMDGGVRSGQDIMRAVCLGAKGCMLGRAHLYGLAAAGEAGVRKSLEIIAHEFDFTTGMMGLTDIADASANLIL